MGIKINVQYTETHVTTGEVDLDDVPAQFRGATLADIVSKVETALTDGSLTSWGVRSVMGPGDAVDSYTIEATPATEGDPVPADYVTAALVANGDTPALDVVVTEGDFTE